MKKRIIFILTLFSLIFPITVNAATGSIKASVSSSKVTLNNTFNVTVKVSSDAPIGSWQFNIEYDSSKVSLQSGDTMIVGYGDGTFNSKTYTYKFKAVGLGSASINVTGAKIADYDTVTYISTTSGGATVTISEAVSIVYSSDNNLSSLSVDDYEITPAFNKNTLEYSVVLAPGATSVKINAKAAHAKAKISGAGEVNVAEGDNNLAIVVTAENGATKTYTLKVTVPEKEPIKIDKYKIFRKLPEEKPLYFNEKTITVNDEEIAVLFNEKLNITLVYASDEKDKSTYYEWKNNKIGERFITLNSGTLSIKVNENSKETPLKGAKKAILKLSDLEINNAYQLSNKSKYYIVSGTDLVTGKSHFYSYDTDNNTLQIFDKDSYTDLFDQINEKMIIIYALSGSLLIFILITILLGRNKSKMKKIEAHLEPEQEKRAKKKSNE